VGNIPNPNSESDADKKRGAHLHWRGFGVLRFWNNDVLTNPEGVCRLILEAL